MTNSCVRCLTGVGYSICWIAISIWAILFFGVLGILFHFHKSGNLGHLDPDDENHKMRSIYVVLIYIVLLIYCSFQLWYRKKNPYPEDEEETKVD